MQKRRLFIFFYDALKFCLLAVKSGVWQKQIVGMYLNLICESPMFTIKQHRIERYMAEFWCFAEKLVGDIQPGVNALDLLLFVGLYVFECRTLEISMFGTLVQHSEFDIRYNLLRLVTLYKYTYSFMGFI